MLPKSNSSTATSIDATQRRLNAGIVMATLLTLAAVIADLASGGRPDPPTLRAAATTLDGAWRFHTGDEPRLGERQYRRWRLGDDRHDRLAGQPRRRRGSARLRRRVDGARSSGLCRLRLVPARGDGAGRTRVVGHPRADPRRGRLRTLLERQTTGRVGAASARARVSSERGRCGSPFPTMRPAPAAYSPFARSCVTAPRPAQTAAACTARPSWLRGRSAMRSTACNGNEPSPATSST